MMDDNRTCSGKPNDVTAFSGAILLMHIQISMNVNSTMEGVNTIAPILMAVIIVLAIMGTLLKMTSTTVLVG